MDELESEDSLDGTLVIDEPNYDNNIIEISDDTDSDADVEVVELDDSTNFIPSLLNSSSSLSKPKTACKVCSKIFLSNNDLLNHIRKFKGKIGNCKVGTNIMYSKRKNTEDLQPEHLLRKNLGKPPKNSNIIEPTVPVAIPLNISFCPSLIPINNKPTPPPSNSLPSLRQILVDEIEPEYTCTTCGQTFRHNIGLLCHLDSEHNDATINQVKNKKKKLSTKLVEKKTVSSENKLTENNEPISNTVDLTLVPNFKKESLWNRIKSYVYSANKNQVFCVLCKLEFKSTKKALAHVEDKHIMDKIQCGYCNMKFVYELKLRSHMARRHKVIGVYKCDKCSKMINKEECESHSKKCKGIANPVNIKTEDTNLKA
ncbi:uncharacterized protein LOC112693814 [Sipha flava]|jgi:DNA-directed RNA polymerase subunit RPC12/RpoP|uniref:Uncharacterized protein LOC112693814 n=1 Tax=Sipha flava TaxID=143950 RepID=A0A2S2PVF1_9HEMI|nr:uncharacterized protein LOC112693814 [Sipha flava]